VHQNINQEQEMGKKKRKNDFPVKKLIEEFSNFESFVSYLKSHSDKYVGVYQSKDHPLSLWALHVAVNIIKKDKLTNVYFSNIKSHLNFFLIDSDGEGILLLKTKIKLPGTNEYLYKKVEFYPRGVEKWTTQLHEQTRWVCRVDEIIRCKSQWHEFTGNELLELIDPVINDYIRRPKTLEFIHNSITPPLYEDEDAL
jgi:hypothetical protein